MAKRIATILVVMFFAAPTFAGLFESPSERSQREANAMMWAQAREQLREQIGQFNEEIAAARAKFWETYPDKPGSQEAQQRFWDLLREKDRYYLAKALGGRLVDAGVEDELDGGIRRVATPEFEDLVKVAADRFRGGDMMQMGSQFFNAINCCPTEYRAYRIERDWWEFDSVGRLPSNCDTPEEYGACLYLRWGHVSSDQAGAMYESMVELLGKQVVYDAAKRVMAAPKTESGRLVVNVPEPWKIGPGGSKVEDNDVPMPDGVIGVYSVPLTALEILATKDDDRRYLLSVLKGQWVRQNRALGTNQWAFAAAMYDRLKIAFGEKELLAAGRAVRTAKKRMTSGGVMNPAAIGATRSEPFETLEDILARKNPVGFTRMALIFSAYNQLTTPAAVDAAYTKFVSENGEDEVLEAAEQMAAARPNLLYYGELETLKKVLDGSLTFEEPKPTGPLVDFPEYVAWKKFKPGAKVSYATRYWKQDQLSYQMPVRSNRLIPEMQHHHAYQMQTITDDQVKLWFTQTGYDRYGNLKPADDKEIAYPAKYTPPAQPRPPANAPVPTGNAAWGAKRTSAPVESGDEIVEINGKRIATRWQSASYSYDDGCKLVVKVWTSDEVPTGLIRRVEDKSCAPGPGKPYGVRFVSETFLESFDGFTPATPDPSKPVAAAYAPQPMPRSSQPVAANPVAPAPKPVAQQPSPAPVPAKRTLAQPPPRMPTPAGLPPEAAAQFELAQRSNQDMFRAQQAKRELTLRGGEIPANVRDARDRLDDQYKAVLTAISQRDNAQAAQALQSMENSLAVIEKYLSQ